MRGKTSPRAVQQHIDQFLTKESKSKIKTKMGNIPPCGDVFVRRSEGDGIFRVGGHNIHGTSLGKQSVIEEIEQIHELGFNVMGLCEINKPWNSGNKWKFEQEMNRVVGNHVTRYASAHARHDVNYLQGGVLLSVNGGNAGRYHSGSDDRHGRFSWISLQGGRGEGVCFIMAYRVPHEKSDNPGPLTGYTMQYTALRQEGKTDPNPRQDILDEITSLISDIRKKGFRPVVMMDANGDAYHESKPDRKFAKFIEENGLVDEYSRRYPEQIRT